MAKTTKYRDAKYASDAKERFDWELTPRLVEFDPHELTPEEWQWIAQRLTDAKRASEMALYFMPALAAGVVVARAPDGFRYVTDGLHRCLSASLVGATVWVIWFDMNEDQAAAMFRLKNGKAIKQSTPMDGAFAARVSGYAPQLETDRILARYDCTFQRSKRWVDGAIHSETIIEEIFTVGNGWLLDRTLDVITTCWGRGRRALSVEVLHGVALFIGHYGQRFNPTQQREMVMRFREANLVDTLDKALANHKAYRGSLGTRAHYFEVELIKLYNARRTDPKRLEERSASSLAREADLAKLARKWQMEHGSEDADAASQGA